MCELWLFLGGSIFPLTSLFSAVRVYYFCFHMDRDDHNRLKAEGTGKAKSARWCPVLFVALVCVLCCEGQDLFPLFTYCWIHNSWFSEWMPYRCKIPEEWNFLLFFAMSSKRRWNGISKEAVRDPTKRAQSWRGGCPVGRAGLATYWNGAQFPSLMVTTSLG